MAEYTSACVADIAASMPHTDEGCCINRMQYHMYYCYCYMVQDLPEHPVGSQRGSWGTSVIARI
jgi:hypothetical protein